MEERKFVVVEYKEGGVQQLVNYWIVIPCLWKFGYWIVIPRNCKLSSVVVNLDWTKREVDLGR